jgi:quinol monooxygenase YgiN
MLAQQVLEGFAIAAANSAPAGAVFMIQSRCCLQRIWLSRTGCDQSACRAEQKEAGAPRYDVYEEPDSHLNHFSIVAAGTNEKTYDDHEAAPNMKQFRATIAQIGKRFTRLSSEQDHCSPGEASCAASTG